MVKLGPGAASRQDLPAGGAGRYARAMRTPIVLAALVALATPALAEGRIDRARIAGEGKRPCPHYGPGFSAVPGTGACTRVSGRVRAEAGTPFRRGPEREAGLSASGRLAIDTRTETDFGPARAFVRFGTRR